MTVPPLPYGLSRAGNETKRRLLLSKWQANRDELERLRAEVEELESARDEAWDDVKSLEDERNTLQSQLDDMEGPGAYEVLGIVKYWLHDNIVFGKPLRDPAAMLREVEEALEL